LRPADRPPHRREPEFSLREIEISLFGDLRAIGQFDPPDVCSFSIIRSMLKLAAFGRGGDPANGARNWLA